MHPRLSSSGFKCENEGCILGVHDPSLFTCNYQANRLHRSTDSKFTFFDQYIKNVTDFIPGWSVQKPWCQGRFTSSLKDLLSQRDITARNWHKNNPEYVVEGEDVTKLSFFFINTDQTIQLPRYYYQRQVKMFTHSLTWRTHKKHSWGLWKAKQIQGPGDINWNNVTIKS